MVRNRHFSPAEPPLASLNDLDDARVADICIGVPDGPGGRFRLLQRLRATQREAVRQAGRTACHLVEASRETLLDPLGRPSAIRIRDRPEGAYIWLDFDVGVMAEGRPRACRALRLLLLSR